MPFYCAKAVCATFCYSIAGALIPIFGPTFPSQCIHHDAPEYGRMTISPLIIESASKEAEINRRIYHDRYASETNCGLIGQRRDRKDSRSVVGSDRRLALKTRLVYDSPCTTDTDGEEYRSEPNSATSSGTGFFKDGYVYTPVAHMRYSGWTAANHPGATYTCDASNRHQHANPLLSAIPRYVTSSPHQTASIQRVAKRVMERDESDYGYEGSESHNGSSPAMSSIIITPRHGEPSADVAEKKAAFLLMNLSVQDQNAATAALPPNEAAAGTSDEPGSHRNKRRRATSM
jgi:hypothetical protein